MTGEDGHGAALWERTQSEISGHSLRPSREYELKRIEEALEEGVESALQAYLDVQREGPRLLDELDRLRSKWTDAVQRKRRLQIRVARLAELAKDGGNARDRLNPTAGESNEQKEAKAELPGQREKLRETSDRVDELEDEYERKARFLEEHFRPLAVRRNGIGDLSLPDQQKVADRVGQRPPTRYF